MAKNKDGVTLPKYATWVLCGILALFGVGAATWAKNINKIQTRLQIDQAAAKEKHRASELTTMRIEAEVKHIHDKVDVISKDVAKLVGRLP